MDQPLRNKLRSVVGRCRKLLEDAVSKELEGRFAIYMEKGAVHADRKARLPETAGDEDRAARNDILDHFEHIQARGFKPRDAFEQLVREMAFTHLNRLCAYKLMEARGVFIGGEKFREAVSRGTKSNGYLFYLADHPDDERLHNLGQQEIAYRHFLDWLGGRLSEEIGVLFSPSDPANRLYPPQRVLDDVLELLNDGDIKPDEAELREAWPMIWSQDETIGWIYQYFTPKEQRDQARKKSQAPRNSYELAFRNQFFTPRYVVEFLTDNTLGRIWYEMRKGNTRLKDQCKYLVRRPAEVFLVDPDEFLPEDCRPWVRKVRSGDFSELPDDPTENELASVSLAIDGYGLANHVGVSGDPAEGLLAWAHERCEEFKGTGSLPASSLELWLVLFCLQRNSRWMGDGPVDDDYLALWRRVYLAWKASLTPHDDASQEELLKQPVFVPRRPKKDPRDLKILDPACGSGHFLLYCFDLLQTIYEEAYEDPDLNRNHPDVVPPSPPRGRGAGGEGENEARSLRSTYPTLDDLRRDVPRLILAHNLHGIDIDLRATQIAALALWLRSQRAYQELRQAKKTTDHGQLTTDVFPKITRTNIVCAEPMPGERPILDEFLKTLKSDRLETLIRRVLKVSETARVRATEPMAESLCDLVELVWEKMQLAGEAGSLLKIEEELQEAIREGQEAWEDRQNLFRVTEYSLTEQPREKYLRFVPGEGVSFWERAEALVMAALDDFASFASNGQRFQRRLFVDDAIRGFAFVDVCRQRFDAVLMNPPFGELAIGSKSYVDLVYPDCRSDYYPSFVTRAVQLLGDLGRVGAITNRTGFFLTGLADWRSPYFHSRTPLTVFADLGHGILDDALVETAAYVVSGGAVSGASDAMSCVCFSLLSTTNDLRKSKLLELAGFCARGYSDGNLLVPRLSSLRQLPDSPFAYRVPPFLLTAFRSFPPLGSNGRALRVTNPNGDDFRFLRARWEVPADWLGRAKRWAPLAKGGEYSPFYADVHLVVDWDDTQHTYNGYEGTPHRPLIRPASCDWFFKRGFTFSRRTASRFSPRILPEGCVFSDKGPAIFPSAREEAMILLGLLSSRPFQALLEMYVCAGDATSSGAAARSYEVGTLRHIPLPMPRPDLGVQIQASASRVAESTRQETTADELSSWFIAPFKLDPDTASIVSLAAIAHRESCNSIADRLRHTLIIDSASIAAYDLPQACRTYLDEVCGKHPAEYPEPGHERAADIQRAIAASVEDNIEEALEAGTTGRHIAVKSFFADRATEVVSHRYEVSALSVISLLKEAGPSAHALARATRSLLSYCVGCVNGRWDVRYAVKNAYPERLPDIWAPIPACAPGALVADDGRPVHTHLEDYPLRITAEGVTVDDSGHSDDLVRRVRDVFEVFWKDRAEAIEKEACEILEVKELRDYFRKPGKGGFWDDHVARYSKSRRKAPIYWLLQSSRKNYALWLYYHRLDKDLLYKALVDYVEPKVQREVNRLDELRKLKGESAAEGTPADAPLTPGPSPAGGRGGKGNKKLEKEIEKQEDFVAELHDFADKLRKVANLGLEPDLNDGVVLNIAPLHELVPWKEAKKYWTELVDEKKYDWSTIGKQLREKGIVK